MPIAAAITKRIYWKGCTDMSKKQANINPSIQPTPKVLVSCRGLDGKDNALAVAYCCNCSYDPPMVMVGIVPSRYSYKMIKESGCFVVNLPAKENKALFDYLGSHSGRDEDKLKNAHAKISDGVKVKAPILDDCPINIECSVEGSILSGSHEMFVGKIEYIHADPRLLNENEDIDFKAANLL
jgi:flavin reductase (DIM6/NTAB) family NADH-FMN oxidoreductase RutF